MKQWNKFEVFRSRVPAAQKEAYFDTGTTGLIPDFIYDAARSFEKDRYQNVAHVWNCGGEPCHILEMMEWAKTALAKMIHGDKNDIFFGQNASQGFSILTTGLELGPGDNVVLPDNGWMSNRFAWQCREKDGLEIRYAETKDGKLTPESVFAQCDEHTKVVSLVYVDSATGYRCDVDVIGEFCRSKGIWFAVDAVQALGVLHVNVERSKIDFLVGNDYKWMMNFCGTGFGYVSPRLREKLQQRSAGWMSDDERFNTAKWKLRLRDDAGRFEFGYPDVAGIYGLGLMAEAYNKLGAQDIEDYVLDLTDGLYDQAAVSETIEILNKTDRTHRSPLVNIKIKDSELTTQKLKEEGVIGEIKDRPEGRILRAAIHYYNNRADIEKLCAVLERRGQ